MSQQEHICNWCGLSCGLETSQIDPSQMIEGGLLDASVLGGYSSTPGNGSGALDDLDQYEFSLCEWCLDHMFSQFRIPPKVQNYMDEEIKEFIPAAKRVEMDDWRSQKQEFYEEWTRRNSARKK